MLFKKGCATILLMLFCCILYAKKGYKIWLCPNNNESSLTQKQTPPPPSGYATLSLAQWDRYVPLDSVKINKKGEFLFSGNHSLQPGEYVIRYGDRTIEFFVSQEGYNEEIYHLDGNKIIQIKGNPENGHFSRFQNLVNEGWKKFSSAARLQASIDSTTAIIEKELPHSLFLSMLRGNAEDSGQIIASLKDPRIIHTRFGKNITEKLFKEIEYNSSDTVIHLLEKIINEVPATVKPRLAATAFDYFSSPQIMGQETVACFIANNYFINGLLEVPEREVLFTMKAFVMFNEHSLVGMDAPELALADTAGTGQSLHTLIGGGEYTILYFYADDCITCKLETPLLVDFVNDYNKGVLNVYAVYTREHADKWKQYIESHLYIYNPFVTWINVYDPGADSGYHLLYNVISTPQLYLLDKNGLIIGKNLSVASLRELLERLAQEKDDLHLFFNNYFKGAGSTDSTAVHRGIDAFYEKSLDNPALFKELFSELYLFLKNSSSYLLQEGAAYLGEKYILQKSGLWNHPEYILRIKKALELFNMNKPGELAANVLLEDENGHPFHLYDLKNNYKVLYFFNTTCGLCRESTNELKKIDVQLRSTGANIGFLGIYTGQNKGEWLQYITDNHLVWKNGRNGSDPAEIYRKYNLEQIPAIYLLDKNNRVIARELTPETLTQLLGTLPGMKNKQ